MNKVLKFILSIIVLIVTSSITLAQMRLTREEREFDSYVPSPSRSGKTAVEVVGAGGGAVFDGQLTQGGNPLSTTNTLPVSLYGTVPTHGVTQSGSWVLDSITNPVAVTGTFWQATQPVSLAAIPLATDAATLTEQQNQSGVLTNIKGNTSDILLKLDDLSTHAKQDTQITILNSIDSKLTSPLSVSLSSLPLATNAATLAEQQSQTALIGGINSNLQMITAAGFTTTWNNGVGAGHPGNAVMSGGMYKVAPPTLIDGDASELILDNKGNLKTVIENTVPTLNIGGVDVNNWPSLQLVSGSLPGVTGNDSDPVPGTTPSNEDFLKIGGYDKGSDKYRIMKFTGDELMVSDGQAINILSSIDSKITPANTTVTGSLTSLGSTVIINTDGLGTVTIRPTGTYTLFGTIEVTTDGTNWDTFPASLPTSGVSSQVSSNTTYVVGVGGFKKMRVRCSSYVSGTMNLTLSGSTASPYATKIYSDATTQILTASNMKDGSGNNLTSQVSGSQRALDVGINVAGVQVDPRSIRALTTADQVTATISGTPTVNLGTIAGVATETTQAAGNTTLSTISTTLSSLLTKMTDGLQRVQLSSATPSTYTANDITARTPAATATDICTISGSATKTIKIIRANIITTQTTAGQNFWYLIKRSTANTGGTSAALTSTPMDSTYAAATASVLGYTANPTALGTSVGAVRHAMILSPAVASLVQTIERSFSMDNLLSAPVVLRGTTQVLAINFNGAAIPAGMTVRCSFEWIEE